MKETIRFQLNNGISSSAKMNCLSQSAAGWNLGCFVCLPGSSHYLELILLFVFINRRRRFSSWTFTAAFYTEWYYLLKYGI
jgi:hypothetical protein